MSDIQIEANAMIQALQAQRNSAMDQVVQLIGQIALLKKQLEAKEAVNGSRE